MRQAIRLLLLLGLLGVASAQGGEVLFRVEQAGGLDMEAGKLAALLASPELEVRITYAPVVAVPGWTGRLGLCGISGLSDVCIKKRWRSLFLRGRDIAREPDGLRFRVPGWHWFGPMPYRPAGPVRVSLPALWPGALPVNIDTTLAAMASGDPLMDMHLPPPYTGVATWRSDATAPVNWRIEACHPGIALGEALRPQVRGHRQAEAYTEWLRALADSDWWAAQIADVRREQGSAGTVDWRRVQVQRGDVALHQLRVETPRLLSSQCPGQSRQEFTWLNGQLLAVVHSETPELFSDDAQCDAIAPVLYEAVWWQGVLQRYTQADGQGQWSDDYWRDRDAACEGHGVRTEPDTRALQQQAAFWWQRLGEPDRP